MEDLTLEIVLAISGCMALLIGLFGGGVKAKEITIPKLSALARFLSSLIGMALIGTAIWLPTSPQPLPQPTSSPSVETEPAATAGDNGVITHPLPLPTHAPINPPVNPATDTPTDTPTTATPTREFGSPNQWSDYFCLENEVCTTADVNGDGKADLIAFLRDSQPEPGRYDVYVGLSTGNDFAWPSKWSDFFC